MSDSKTLDAHVFVCTNTKANGESCGAKGSVELREQLKNYCQKTRADWHGRVRINASGCLGRCAEGITAVVYPQGHWHTHLDTKTGADKVVADLTAILDAKR